MFAYKIIDRIRERKVIIRTKFDVCHLLTLMLGNNITFPDAFCIKLQPYLYVDDFNFLKSIVVSKYKGFKLHLSNIEEVANFFSMMLGLGCVCSKALRERLNRQLNEESREIFHCGLKVYFDLIHNEIEKNDVINKKDGDRRKWFINKINVRRSEVLLRSNKVPYNTRKKLRTWSELQSYGIGDGSINILYTPMK